MTTELDQREKEWADERHAQANRSHLGVSCLFTPSSLSSKAMARSVGPHDWIPNQFLPGPKRSFLQVGGASMPPLTLL